MPLVNSLLGFIFSPILIDDSDEEQVSFGWRSRVGDIYSDFSLSDTDDDEPRWREHDGYTVSGTVTDSTISIPCWVLFSVLSS